jgi:hypothetical protein
MVASTAVALAVEMGDVYRKSMAVYKTKRGPGRPPGTTYRETIPVRLTVEAAAAVDAWAARQNERGISRSEAIRRLVDRALEAEAGGRRRLDTPTLNNIIDARAAMERALVTLRRLVRDESGKR